MPFAFNVVLSDPSNLGGGQDANLVTDLNQALTDWSTYIGGLGTLQVLLDFSTQPASSLELATGGPYDGITAGPYGSRTLVTPSSIYELTTGTHIQGDQYDIEVTLNSTALSQIYASPDPSQPYSVPANQYDAVSLLTHEIGHGLGFGGFTAADGSLGSYATLWDTFVQKNANGTASFVGPNAEAAYGGPVPVTTMAGGEAYSHISNSAGDRLANDLMSGLGEQPGTIYSISTVDLAILKDVGVPVNADTISSANPPVFRFYDSSNGSHFYTDSEAEVQTIMARNPALSYEGQAFNEIGQTSASAASPVFRFYNTQNHEHFFTISAAERGQIIATDPGLRDEGVAFYASQSDEPGFVPVYRFYNTRNGSHFFTSNQAEKQSVMANLGAFHYEGIGFYVPAASDTPVV